jgi:competence ComEA-like helix-hairpin-helix protein
MDEYAMLGFTRNEQKVLLFLIGAFFLGFAVKVYQEHYQPLPDTPDNPMDYQTTAIALPSGRHDEEAKIFEPLSGPISVNSAGAFELERLPGIGPAMAKRIIDYRDRHGKFTSIEELHKIKGIGAKTLKKIRPYIQID